MSMIFTLRRSARLFTIALSLAFSGVASAATLIEERHDCLITPRALVNLGAEVQGVVDSIDVQRGDKVVAGQLVAQLKATVERANVAQAQERVSMDSEIRARKADVDYTRQVLERQISLSKQALSSQQAIDEARARHLVANAALSRAMDNAVDGQHELLRHEALLAQRSIVSPIDGVVVRRHVEPGELVIDTPVVTVAALDSLRVDVVLPAQDYARFRAGDRARVFPETTPSRGIDARVTVVDPMLDSASGTFAIRLDIDNADRSVLAGQECQVIFSTDRLAEND